MRLVPLPLSSSPDDIGPGRFVDKDDDDDDDDEKEKGNQIPTVSSFLYVASVVLLGPPSTNKDIKGTLPGRGGKG